MMDYMFLGQIQRRNIVNIYHRESSRLVAQGDRIRFTGQDSYVKNKQYVVNR